MLADSFDVQITATARGIVPRASVPWGNRLDQAGRRQRAGLPAGQKPECKTISCTPELRNSSYNSPPHLCAPGQQLVPRRRVLSPSLDGPAYGGGTLPHLLTFSFIVLV